MAGVADEPPYELMCDECRGSGLCVEGWDCPACFGEGGFG